MTRDSMTGRAAPDQPASTFDGQAITPLWLLPADGGGVRLWGPAMDCRFEVGLRADVATADLLEGEERRPLSGLVDPGLAAQVGECTEAAPVLLHLADSLPEAYHHLPWEWLRHRGEPLGRRLVAVRHCPETAEPPDEPIFGPHLFASLFPPHELPPLDQAPNLPASIETRWAPEEARAHLEREDLAGLGVLYLYSHGSEAAGSPLRLPDGRTWALPGDRGWPSVVVLIACGDANGELVRYARERVAAGADAVLVAQGRLEAAQALTFARDFSEWLLQGRSLGAALAAARARAHGEHGARRMLLVGRPDMRVAAEGVE
ncbi:MAG: CHAT domain-containing protein, partial [Thiohalorhabdaceae bacterium]